MKFCFLDQTKFEYSYMDKYSPILRGAETILINLSENLKKFGHNVTVFNNCSDKIHNDSSKWYIIKKLNISENFSKAKRTPYWFCRTDLKIFITATETQIFGP